MNNNIPEIKAAQDAILEFKVAENFFNICESHQFDYANARLTSAIEKVNTTVKDAKLVCCRFYKDM